MQSSLQIRILAVIVRYKAPIEDSATMRTLATAFAANPGLLNEVAVLIWDNSPIAIQNRSLPFACEYEHSAENKGVSGAYNSALGIAQARDIPWLLLLDQDTSLPEHFLAELLECAQSQENSSIVGAIAPFLFDGERPISPSR